MEIIKFIGLYALGFGILLIIISPFVFIGAQILLLKRRKFKYAILLLCPVVFVYLYNFTNTFYCLECIVTFNSPRMTEWDNNYENIYVYNCFDNNEEQVYWFFDQIANRSSGRVFTNIQAVSDWDGISYDDTKTDRFEFIRFAGAGNYKKIEIIMKDGIDSSPLYQSFQFEDSAVFQIERVGLDFNMLRSMYFSCDRNDTKVKENYSHIWKDADGKALVIVRYFNYGEYFKVEFPNRKKGLLLELFSLCFTASYALAFYSFLFLLYYYWSRNDTTKM